MCKRSLNLIMFLILSIIVAHLNAQVALKWTKVLETPEYDCLPFIQESANDGYILLFTTGVLSSNGGAQIGLTCLNNVGDVVWSRIYDDLFEHYPTMISYCETGGYIIAGYVIVNMLANESDIFILKVSEDGIMEWRKQIQMQDEWGSSVSLRAKYCRQTYDHGYIILGTSYSNSYDVYLIKTDSLGTITWQKHYDKQYTDYIIRGKWLQYTKDGEYIIAGDAIARAGDSMPWDNDIFALRLDALGNEKWYKVYKGKNEDRFGEIKITYDDKFYITAMTNRSTLLGENGAVWLLKLDSNGDTLWTKTLSTEYICWGGSLDLTSDDGVVIGAGGFIDKYQEYVFIIKADNEGKIKFTRSYPFNSYSQELGNIIETKDKGFILTGRRYIMYQDNPSDIFIIKTDSNGETDLSTEIQFDNSGIPHTSVLYPNYPNPFNSNTVLSWQLAVGSDAELSVYNLLGQKVATLVSKRQSAGYHNITWDGSGFASGVYYYRLEVNGPTGNFQQVRKMVLLR